MYHGFKVLPFKFDLFKRTDKAAIFNSFDCCSFSSVPEKLAHSWLLGCVFYT
ncbi:hypothetical protein PRUB_b0498 [Pseudoalteromonas rubra]|uniref:Uncharacterized protein n=1 Tax=Pseudoalteromonas rubra TaxID=43658 RepID=A0A8T0C232_9GAMM|nr:hypothetical protein PRUB_b0498 [Pseudoalteromonas rubra]